MANKWEKLVNRLSEMVQSVVDNIREEDAKLAIRAKQELDAQKQDASNREGLLRGYEQLLSLDLTPEQKKDIQKTVDMLRKSLEVTKGEDKYASYKQYKNVGLKNQQHDKYYQQTIKPIVDRYKKISDKIEQAYQFMYIDLNAKSSDKTWGGRPIDDEMGDVYGDEKSQVYLKPHEAVISNNHGDFEVINGVKIELIVVNPKYRGQGLAKARLQELTTLADKYGVNLYLDVAPQDKSTTEEGLVALYKQFGFVFDGTHGVRKPLKKKI
jgi:GNAT superfamily N-acetyltransferase